MGKEAGLHPDFDPVIEEIVSQVIEELERRRSPSDTFVTREWVKKTEASIDEAIDVVFKPLADLHPEVQPALREVVQSIVRESWKITAKQLQPKAWVEKWWAAETDEDRQRIFYWALKNHCLDEKRKQKVEERLFTSLDELQDRADGGAEDSKGGGPPLPSMSDNPELIELKAKLQQAILELPIMLAVIVHLLPLANGNASKLSRHLGVPQRQMSRHLARIREHFKKHGLET